MPNLSLFDQLERWRADARLSELGLGPVPPDASELLERIEDRLRVDSVAPVVAAAAGADRSARGERLRDEFRAVRGPYLDQASRAIDTEISRCIHRQERPCAGYWSAVALDDDPDRRRLQNDAWVRSERGLEDLRHERRKIREDAARSVGAMSLLEYHDSATGRSSAEVLERFRAAIDALDRAVGTAALDLQASSHADRSQIPRIAGLVEHRAFAPLARIRSAVRRIAAELGANPDLPETLVVLEPAATDWAEVQLGGGAPVSIVLGTLDGPEALARAVAVGVQAARAVHVRTSGRSGSCDPAYAAAASALGRRLASSPTFLETAGIFLDHRVRNATAWAAAVVPRKDWAYLDVAVSFPRAAATEDEAWRRLERATGLLPTPDEIANRFEPPSEAGPALRGTAFALLLEERLLTRFGRRWFEQLAARRLLRELWDAEPHEAPEEMATALSLGTMDSAPLIERCRPWSNSSQ